MHHPLLRFHSEDPAGICEAELNRKEYNGPNNDSDSDSDKSVDDRPSFTWFTSKKHAKSSFIALVNNSRKVIKKGD